MTYDAPVHAQTARRARRRRESEVLPPPDIPSYRNIASLEEWRRKYERLDVDQIDKNHGVSR